MQTQFGRDLDDWLKDPEFADEYRNVSARLSAVDVIVCALESARVDRGMSKAAVAAAAGSPAQSVRRFFTQSGGNPTLWTTVAIAEAVGVLIGPVAMSPVATPAELVGAPRNPRSRSRGAADRPVAVPQPIAAASR